MQDPERDYTAEDAQSARRLLRAYKDIAKNAKISLDYLEEYASELAHLDSEMRTRTAPDKLGRAHSFQSYLGRTATAAGVGIGGRARAAQRIPVEHESDATDDETECMPISCVVAIVRHIVLAFASTEHLEQFIAELKRFTEISEARSFLHMSITIDGSASSYHVCDLTNQQLYALFSRGLYHETDVVDTGTGYMRLIKLPLMACVKLPFIESAGVQVNLTGRILPAQVMQRHMGADVSDIDTYTNKNDIDLTPFAAKRELPNLLKPVYENVVMHNGRAVTHTSYLGVASTAELLYDSERTTEYGLPLVGTIDRDSLIHYQFLTAKHFEHLSYYPVAVSLVAYVFCNSSRADEFIRRYKQKTEIVTRISRSSAILNTTLREREKTESIGTFTHEDLDFIRLQCKQILSLQDNGLICAMGDNGHTNYYYKEDPAANQLEQGTQYTVTQAKYTGRLPPQAERIVQQSPLQRDKRPQKSTPSGDQVPIFISNLECRYLPDTVSTVTLDIVFGLYPGSQSLPPVPATNGHAMWVGEIVTLLFSPYKIVPYLEYRIKGYDIKHTLCYSDVAILSLIELFPMQQIENWSSCKVVGQIYSRVTTPLTDQNIISSMSIFTATGQIYSMKHDMLETTSQDLDSTGQLAISQNTLRDIVSSKNIYSSVGARNYQLRNADDDSILSLISETADIDKHIHNLSHLGHAKDDDPLSILQLSATGAADYSAMQFKGERKGNTNTNTNGKYDIMGDSRLKVAAVLSKYDRSDDGRKKNAGHPPSDSESNSDGETGQKSVPQKIQQDESSSSYVDSDSSSSAAFSVDIHSGLERPRSNIRTHKVAAKKPGAAYVSKEEGYNYKRACSDSSVNSDSSDSGDKNIGSNNSRKDAMPNTQWFLDRAKTIYGQVNIDEESDSLE